MAMTTCKECKAQISTKAEACPQCGAKQIRTSGCAMVAAVVFGLVFLSAVLRGCSGETAPPASSTSDSTTAAPVASTTPAKVDPAAVLVESKGRVAEAEARLKENTTRLKKYYGTPHQLEQATKDMIHLAVVKGLYADSKVKEEQSLSRRADALISKVAKQQRAIYASTAEEIFVKNGMDVSVSASGAKSDQLRLKYVLMSQPLVCINFRTI